MAGFAVVSLARAGNHIRTVGLQTWRSQPSGGFQFPSYLTAGLHHCGCGFWLVFSLVAALPVVDENSHRSCWLSQTQWIYSDSPNKRRFSHWISM